MNAALAKEFSESGTKPDNRAPFKGEPEADKWGAGMLKACLEEIEKQAGLGHKKAQMFYGVWKWPVAELKKLGYEVHYLEHETDYKNTIITW